MRFLGILWPSLCQLSFNFYYREIFMCNSNEDITIRKKNKVEKRNEKIFGFSHVIMEWHPKNTFFAFLCNVEMALGFDLAFSLISNFYVDYTLNYANYY